jgi:phosphoglycolate phosphatase-like HAD superfamily hydrolase
VNELSANGSFAFYSHSSLLSLQFMGARLGLSPALLHHGSTGLDTAGPEGGLRKDNGDEGYLWVCEKEGFNPSQTVMLEDTHRNLFWAKKAGLQTIHIHWGKPVQEKYIDYSFKTTNDALTFLQQSVAVPSQKIA